jgi:hypothetical protein
MVEQRKWFLNTDADAVEYLARVMCAIVGAPATGEDGNPSWWMFNEDAIKIVDNLRKRFPTGNLIQSE